MPADNIPNNVIAVVSDVLGTYLYSHTRIDTLFAEAGAPGDPPQGNCINKIASWLKRCNNDPAVDQFDVLGRILEPLFENDSLEVNDRLRKGKERIEATLTKAGLTYHEGGRIFGATAGPATKSLQQILRSRDLAAVDDHFTRAIAHVVADPPAGLTAASSLLESLCKVYIEDEGLDLPAKQTIKELWKVVSKHIGFSPGPELDEDINRVLSGMTSIVDGIGAWRTHASSAHGAGRSNYRIRARHARLAINAAHAVAVFLIETWDERRDSQ